MVRSMRRSFTRRLWEVGVQSSYILSRYVKHYMALVILASILYSIALLLILLPGGFEALIGVSMLIMVGYIAASIQLSLGFASELESGESLIYLSTPVSRITYTLSWIIAPLVSVVGTFILTLTIPVIILDPGILVNRTFLGMLGTLSGEIIYYIIILTLASLLLKRRSTTMATAFFLLFLGPLISTIILSIYFSISGGGDFDIIRKVVGVFHPALLALNNGALVDYSYSIAYSMLSSMILLALIILYSRRRLEV